MGEGRKEGSVAWGTKDFEMGHAPVFLLNPHRWPALPTQVQLIPIAPIRALTDSASGLLAPEPHLIDRRVAGVITIAQAGSDKQVARGDKILRGVRGRSRRFAHTDSRQADVGQRSSVPCMDVLPSHSPLSNRCPHLCACSYLCQQRVQAPAGQEVADEQAVKEPERGGNECEK